MEQYLQKQQFFIGHIVTLYKMSILSFSFLPLMLLVMTSINDIMFDMSICFLIYH